MSRAATCASQCPGAARQRIPAACMSGPTRTPALHHGANEPQERVRQLPSGGNLAEAAMGPVLAACIGPLLLENQGRRHKRTAAHAWTREGLLPVLRRSSGSSSRLEVIGTVGVVALLSFLAGSMAVFPRCRLLLRPDGVLTLPMTASALSQVPRGPL